MITETQTKSDAPEDQIEQILGGEQGKETSKKENPASEAEKGGETGELDQILGGPKDGDGEKGGSDGEKSGETGDDGPIPAWISQASAEQRANKELMAILKTYPKIPAFISAFEELKKSSKVPETPEEKAAFMRKLGAPENEEGYSFDKIPKEDRDEAFEKFFRSAAFKMNATQEQAEAFYKEYMNWQDRKVDQFVEEEKNTLAKTREILQDMWKGEFETKSALVRGLAARYGSNILSMLGPRTAVEKATALALMAKIAEDIGESKLYGSGGSAAPERRPGLMTFKR